MFVPLNPERVGDKRSARAGWFADANGCHIWQGGRPGGYAYYNGTPVYRLRYEREIGPIPEGMHLDHFVCDNGPGGCCNPHHCRPVTPRENILRSDCPSARAAAKTHCSKGHPLSGDNLIAGFLKRGQRKCKLCNRVRCREYALKNRERIYKRQRQWCKENRDLVNAANRRWKERASH